MTQCEEPDCEADAAVTLHIPWTENRQVCTGHARVWAQKDGVVPEPFDDAADGWR